MSLRAPVVRSGRSKHDPALAGLELGVGHGSVRTGVPHVGSLTESERSLQPLDGGGCVFIGEHRNDG